MRTSTVAFLAGLSLGAAGASLSFTPRSVPLRPSPPGPGVEQMIADFVADYRSDATARPVTFGIEVRDATPARWHVVVWPGEGGAATRPVDFAEGFPGEPVAYFTTDLETLERIHSGELSSLTAMGKGLSSDFAPLDLELQPGFRADPQLMEHLVELSFHFWTRGFPERVRFGDLAHTRPLHGAHGTLFYYQEGFRSGFFHIQPGEHVNETEVSQTNPFPTLFVVTAGRVEARIGDTVCELVGGEAIYIGPGVRHEFWIDEQAGEGAEGVLLMFGEGA